METPSQPLPSPITVPSAGDEPTLNTALWVLGGFILFTALIFFLVIYAR